MSSCIVEIQKCAFPSPLLTHLYTSTAESLSLSVPYLIFLFLSCPSSWASVRCFTRRRLSGLPQAGSGPGRSPKRGPGPADLRPVSLPLPPGWHPAIHWTQTEAVPREPLYGQTSGQATVLPACLTPLHILLALADPPPSAPAEGMSPRGGGCSGVAAWWGLFISTLARNNPQAGEHHR